MNGRPTKKITLRADSASTVPDPNGLVHTSTPGQNRHPVWRRPLPLGIMRAMHSMDSPLPEPEFDVVLRGYDRTQVVDYFDLLATRLDDAEPHTAS